MIHIFSYIFFYNIYTIYFLFHILFGNYLSTLLTPITTIYEVVFFVLTLPGLCWGVRASLVAEMGSGARGLSSCGTGLVVLRHVRFLIPQSGTEPISPALEGGFLTTGP